MTFEQMAEAVDFLVLQGQRFKRREEQYKVFGSVPGTLILEQLLVRHRITKEKFIMKVIRNDTQVELKMQGQAELQALQRTSHWKETIELVDCFTDAQG